MASNLTSTMRCCGSSGIASPGKSSSPVVCCPRPNPTSPYCSGPCQNLSVPIVGIISDGQLSIRGAVAEVFPDVPHQLCHFHYLREAAKPIYEADRHAKKELKKRVRGVRPIERRLAGRRDPEAEVVRGYCAAVRSALTDDGRPPLDASGLKLHDRLSAIAASLEQGAKRGPCPRS